MSVVDLRQVEEVHRGILITLDRGIVLDVRAG
jgi:hypothetical protein